MDYRQYVISKAEKAKRASRVMATLSTDIKDKALLNMAKALRDNINDIVEANKRDLKNGEDRGVSKALLDRLMLNEKRIQEMAVGLEQVVSLADPVGESLRAFKTPNGLQINQIRVPLGVVGMIYEARPNVTVDAAALCIKSGNACVLRGGSEAINSNVKISEIISKAAEEAGLPEGTITLLDVTEREAANAMMRLNGYIDVLIPRGGAGLINAVVQNASIPVIETGVGNCHVFVDETADFKMAEDIIINGKTQRPAVCNAIENILVHEKIADNFLPLIKKALQDKGVELRGCEKTRAIIACEEARDEDWDTEYLDLIIAVKVVKDIDEAIEHIYNHGTKHSECIVTENYFNSQKFLREIDAAAVYVNASTRFTDGGQFGFGAEIGISTQKLHARGPMGLKELTSCKYIIYGEGQIR
ncbi:gamma-glutamyl phosphate reductase [Clostridium polyendosporum]|uniref:Gamma-glutamyl phosphate reductase n=1 Tax=Clostridium polyendosporum TaxID=69208 RepID=A0A919VHT8_9CLOT|nr:glutamate-5-semialdehyde dehydrogenase [Clostridium polyendosporum]GIM30061.1 gamma-glutamyl phosphate reductase [Clostridium polyendosporum]